MQRLSLVIAAAVLAAGLSTLGAQTTTPADRFFASAQHKEIVDGDLKGAIADYTLVVKGAGANRALAAQALLGMAACYEKLGDPQAQAVYRQIVLDYADQTDAVATARRNTVPDPTGSGGPFSSRSISQYVSISSGTNGTFAISPDGTWAAFGAVRGTMPNVEFTLGLRNLSTGSERTLAALLPRPPARGVFQIVFSPDGEWVAAAVDASTGDLAAKEAVVARVTSAGGGPIILPGVRWSGAARGQPGGPRPDNATIIDLWDWQGFQWSPDGSQLLYLSPTPTPLVFEAKILRVGTGEVRPLGILVTGAPDFQWSPTGAEFAIHAINAVAGTDEIRIVAPATGLSRALPVPGPRDVRTRLGVWTSTGQLALRQVRSAPPVLADDWLMDTVTGQVAKSCSEPAKQTEIPRSETSGWRHFTNPNTAGRCLEVRADGTQVIWDASRRLTLHGAQSSDRSLTLSSGDEYFGQLSPDGRLAIFVSNRDRRWGLYGVPLDRVPVSNPVMVARLEDLPSSFNVQWTGDGLVTALSYDEANIVRVPMDPATGRSVGAPDRLTQDSLRSEAPTISADNSRIAYWSLRSGELGLALMDASGANERPLGEAPVGTLTRLAPAWRSAEELLVRTPASGESGRRARAVLATVNALTGAAAPIVIPGFERMDQSWDFVRLRNELIYLADRDAQGAHVFRARSLATGEDRVLATLKDSRGGGPGGASVDFRVSSDGRRIAYFLNNYNWDYSIEGYTKNDLGDCLPCELGVIDIDTQQKTVLASPRTPQVPAAWSPNGRFLLYGAGQARVMNVETRESWPLLTSGQLAWAGTADWSADGAFVVLTASSTRREGARLWQGVTADAVLKLMGPNGGGR